MRTVTKSSPERDFFNFFVKTKKVCRWFANFSSEQEHFTHVMYITALTAKCPGSDEGTNLRQRDFAVVPLMPVRALQSVYSRKRRQMSFVFQTFFSGAHFHGHINTRAMSKSYTCKLFTYKTSLDMSMGHR